MEFVRIPRNEARADNGLGCVRIMPPLRPPTRRQLSFPSRTCQSPETLLHDR